MNLLKKEFTSEMIYQLDKGCVNGIKICGSIECADLRLNEAEVNVANSGIQYTFDGMIINTDKHKIIEEIIFLNCSGSGIEIDGDLYAITNTGLINLEKKYSAFDLFDEVCFPAIQICIRGILEPNDNLDLRVVDKTILNEVEDCMYPINLNSLLV